MFFFCLSLKGQNDTVYFDDGISKTQKEEYKAVMDEIKKLEAEL